MHLIGPSGETTTTRSHRRGAWLFLFMLQGITKGDASLYVYGLALEREVSKMVLEDWSLERAESRRKHPNICMIAQLLRECSEMCQASIDALNDGMLVKQCQRKNPILCVQSLPPHYKPPRE